MKLLFRLPWFRRAAALPLRCAKPQDPLADQLVEEERILGCGWFESTHELLHGLSVHEHPSIDTLVEELPLTAWLELHLAHWQPRVGPRTGSG